MNFISAWLADYPLAPALVFFVPAVLLLAFDVWDYKWGLRYDGRVHFFIKMIYIAAFIVASLLAALAAG